jgi:hypothetical protein
MAKKPTTTKREVAVKATSSTNSKIITFGSKVTLGSRVNAKS